jgi:hypothetical protein
LKKAQVSIFVIIGIVLVVALGFFLVAYSTKKIKDLNSDRDNLILERQGEQIKSYIEQCLYDVSVKGIYLIGLQGGYIDPEYNKYYGDYDNVPWERSGNNKIPYWYYNGKDISPTLEQVEKKLGRYILVEGKNCTNFQGMQSFEGTEITLPETDYQANYFNFNKEKSYINASINAKGVSVNYFFPITLKKGSDIKEIEKYYVEVPITLGQDFEIAKIVLVNATNTNKKGYNLENDCSHLNREGYVNLFPFNSRILLIDYEPYFNPKFQRSFKFQFLYNGLIIYGYCSG